MTAHPMADADPRPTVLIIDDSPENRYVVRRALSRAGMEVLEAGTGAEGTARVHADPASIDLVILDVNLPDTTGFELCASLKRDPPTAHVPVIHLSQSAVDDGSRVRGLEGGADAYLTEPIHGSVLVATVQALLRMRRAEDALRRQAEDADRLVRLNSALAGASSEAEVVIALLDALADPYAIECAHLFAPRPWSTWPAFVYPVGADASARALPISPDALDHLLDEILAPGSSYVDPLAYQAGGAERGDWMVLPLIAFDREVGTLLIEFEPGIVLPPRNQSRLGAAVGRAAEAMERARMFEEQREISAELQASLRPAELLTVPGMSVGAEYRAGAEGMFVGGDFYDVFVADGGWGALIGDVCGRGAAAAARTSLARHTARQAARQTTDSALVLRAVGEAIDAERRNDALDLITAICLHLRPRAGGVDVSCAVAGHPLPILIRAGGTVAEPVGVPGPILGVNAALGSRPVELTLAEGDVLFLYTDGVIEARSSGVLFGEERLVELLKEMVGAGASVQEIARAPIQAAADYNEVHDDDMATLVLRAEPSTA